MTKTAIVNSIAQQAGVSKSKARKLLNILLTDISNSVKAGEKVTLTGFGTFVLRSKKERVHYNIKDGSKVTVPAHKSVGFEVGDTLKKLVQ